MLYFKSLGPKNLRVSGLVRCKYFPKGIAIGQDNDSEP